MPMRLKKLAFSGGPAWAGAEDAGDDVGCDRVEGAVERRRDSAAGREDAGR
jgi:hypothetical protein